MRAIFLKEFSRLKLFLIFLFVATALFFGWFSIDFFYKFGAVHPESVIWYQYVFFDNEPERSALYVVVFTFVCVSLAQFLPQRNRIKCLLHLPTSSFKILLWHYYFAFLFFVIIWLIFGAWLIFLGAKFYPDVIVKEIFINWCYFCLCGIAFYIFASCALIDKKSLRAAISGVVFATVCFVLIFYIKSFLVLGLLIISSIFLGFNSLISHKQTSLNSGVLAVLYCGVLLTAGVGTYKFYEHNFAAGGEKYYIFYSPTLKEFVYQENLGGHYFAYKSASGKVFDSELAYKNELPFNYFMDLKQQGKLPVKIGDELFDEDKIRSARLSMTLAPSDANPPKIPFYPLFNPDPNISAIPFGEDMIYFGDEKFVIYHHDGEKDEILSEILNQSGQNLGVKFPIAGVFGRFTNLKPFDAGLFFKDANGEFFNIKMYGGKLSFTKIESFKNFDYLHVSETNGSEFIGLGFKRGQIYLISDDFNTRRLEVGNFDLAKMRLRISFDPKFLQVRFDDGKSYSVYAFDRDSLTKIDEFYLEAK